MEKKNENSVINFLPYDILCSESCPHRRKACVVLSDASLVSNNHAVGCVVNCFCEKLRGSCRIPLSLTNANKLQKVKEDDSTLYELHGCVNALKFVRGNLCDIEELDLLCDNQSACEFLRDGKSHERQDFNKVRQDYCKEKTAFKRVSENHKLRKDTASADFVARFGDDHYKFLMKLNRFLDDISRFQQNLMNDSKFNDVDLEVLAPVAGHIFSICSLDDYEIDPNGQLMLESFLQIGSKNKILSVCKAVNALLKVANERNGQLEYRMPIVQMCTKQIKYIWLAINEAREDMSRQAAARDEDECMQKEFDRLMHALTLNKIIYGPYDEDDDWGSGSKIFPAFVGFLKSNDPKDGKEQELLNELNSFNDYLKENGPFIGGKQVCAADLLLGPKLYHMDIALGHYKNWSVPEVLTYVKSYMKDIFSRDSFVKTLASRLDVIAGWAKHMG